MSDGKVDAYFAKQEGAVSDIALALRSVIEEIGIALSCKLAWGFPCWSGNERILSILAHSDRCNLQLFYGNLLAEKWPQRIDGTGKQMRHIKVYSVSDIDKELKEIINYAIELDQINPTKVR